MHRYGVLDSYRDAFGKEVFVSDKIRKTIQSILGSSEASLPKIAVLENSNLVLDLATDKVGENLAWKVFQDRNLILQGETARSGNIFRLNLDLPIGYYDLELLNLSHQLLLVVAPERAYIPDAIKQKKRWGLTTQLYSLRKNQNDSFGDFAALKKLKEIAKEKGAAFIGLNPLLATGFPNAVGISPYSPVSRHALNELYISTDLPSRSSDLIDYQAVADYKHKILFQRYKSEGFDYKNVVSEELRNYAIYSALRDSYGEFWQKWPKQYRSSTTIEVEEFYQLNKEKVDYYLYLQFLAQKELSSIVSKDFANDVVLYLDFPVGVALNSSDVWSDQTLYTLEANAGAPPDELAPQGQDWGLPAIKPEALLERSCLPFIKALRFSMQFAGAIRIDHVMSLWRLYWSIGEGSDKDGAYVKYPAKELTSILKLESHLNQCLVIGEDLGTVPDDTRHFMSSSGVLSYKVFYFEKDYHGFKAPEAYETEALSCIGTHDLAPLKGFIEKTDLKERADLSLHETEILDRLNSQRDQDLEALKRFIEDSNLEFEQVLAKLYLKLSKANSMLLAVQLEDLCAQSSQVNLPGTVQERPNWRQFLSETLEELSKKDNSLLVDLKSAI